MEGCDVLTFNADQQIERLEAYVDSGDVARQLGVLRRRARAPNRT